MSRGAAVFNFVKPSRTATLMSSHIAHFIADTLKLPLCWNRENLPKDPLDVLFIVEGPYAFSSAVVGADAPAFERVCRQASKVLWAQIDYTLIPPKVSMTANTPFRRVWRARKKAGLPHIDVWTAERDLRRTGDARTVQYINWNRVTYLPLSDKERSALRAKAGKDLFYYGAYRKNRAEYFHRYFDACPVPLSISGGKKDWAVNWPNAHVLPPMPRAALYTSIGAHGLGLCITDRSSFMEKHSPPNRFYEMLSAGLPMVFQPEIKPIFDFAKLDIAPYIVQNNSDLKRFMRNREDIGMEQRHRWMRPYRKELEEELRFKWKHYTAGGYENNP